MVKLPTPGLFIEQQLGALEKTMSEKTRSDYRDKLEMEKGEFDRIQGNPWKDWFQAGALIQDEEDRVERCGTCGWELTEEVCSRCNSYYPEYSARLGDDLVATSADEEGEDIRFSGDEDDDNEESISSESNQDGFVVEDNVIEYDSAADPLSDRESLDDVAIERIGSSSRQAKRARVISESDDDADDRD